MTPGRRITVGAKMRLAGERRSRRARTPAAVAMTPLRVSIPLLRSYLPAADGAFPNHRRVSDAGPLGRDGRGSVGAVWRAEVATSRDAN